MMSFGNPAKHDTCTLVNLQRRDTGGKLGARDTRPRAAGCSTLLQVEPSKRPGLETQAQFAN
jgi:hypothetical protein